MVRGWSNNVLSYFLNIFKYTGQYIDFDIVTSLSTSVCIIQPFVLFVTNAYYEIDIMCYQGHSHFTTLSLPCFRDESI